MGINAAVGPIRFYPAFQIVRHNDGTNRTHFGCEVEIWSALAGRIGSMDTDYDRNRVSWGVGLKGIRTYEILSGKEVRSPLELSFSFARVDAPLEGMDPYNYYGIEFSY